MCIFLLAYSPLPCKTRARKSKIESANTSHRGLGDMEKEKDGVSLAVCVCVVGLGLND